jgi:hypothetical protein
MGRGRALAGVAGRDRDEIGDLPARDRDDLQQLARLDLDAETLARANLAGSDGHSAEQLLAHARFPLSTNVLNLGIVAASPTGQQRTRELTIRSCAWRDVVDDALVGHHPMGPR